MNFKQWQSFKLEEIIEPGTTITYGVVKPGDEDNNGVKFIRGGDISNGKILIGNLRTITKEISEQYKRTQLQGGELVISLVGNPGEVAIVPPELKGANLARQVGIVRLRSDIEKEFVKYFLISPLGKERLFAKSVGSVQQVINLSELRELEVYLPNLDTQRRIAGVLSALDEKIELNNHTNATLEAMAQAIFREWFVENEQAENWKTRAVGDVVKRISVGKKYDFKTALPEGKVPILDQSHFTVIGYHNEKPGIEASVDSPVLVFSNHRCYTDIIHFPFSAIQNVLPFVGEGVDTRWLYHATDGIITYSEYKGHYPEFISKPLVIPPKELTEQFGKFVKPLHIKIMENKEESAALAAVRDALLPKLMSGEVSVEG